MTSPATPEAFSCERYLEAQMHAFGARIADGPNVVEFGGKPFGDHHASRVLPGYEPDIKATILRELRGELGDATIALTVHGQDILTQPDGRRVSRRIRGDSGLTYDDEMKRLVEEADTRFGLPISAAVIAAVPDTLSEENADYLGTYVESLGTVFDAIHTLPAIAGYPFLEVTGVVDQLTSKPAITKSDRSLIVVSPGGGSGKFGVAVSEIAHKLQAGEAPNFIKFETFPVFGLDPSHPLNLAFLAATADLPNQLLVVGGDVPFTNYDKDVENLQLLKTLLTQFPDNPTSAHEFEIPTDMGVNVIEKGITDEQAVWEACRKEIQRRIARYQGETARGVESAETVQRTQDILDNMIA